MARKKIIFVIVEGPSDDQALDAVLSRIFIDNTVHVHIIHGDITTNIFPANKNIKTAITDELKMYVGSNSFRASDILKVIHIMDTDGAFVPDEIVDEDPELEKAKYLENKIIARDRNAFIKRNKIKSNNMRILSGTKYVWKTIAYEAYYMSSNLDHVLHNKQNSSDEEKANDSFNFAQKYKNDIPGFIKWLSEAPFTVNGDYRESWEFIEKGLNSLQRHTNFSKCFEDEIIN